VLPNNLLIKKPTGKHKIKLTERLLALLFGAFFGALTFIIWILVILIKGGPLIAKASVAKGMMFLFGAGIALALPMAIVIGLIGFLLGEARLAKFLGIIWGTDREFNMKMHDALSRAPEVPRGVIVLILSIIIVATFAYLLRILR
jgi:polyferredoxin